MAEKTKSVLKTQAEQIRDETAKNANTAIRVGGHEVDIVDSVQIAQAVTFSESIKADVNGYFPDYTQTGALNFTKDASIVDNEGYGNGLHGIIIASGDDWDFSSDFDVVHDQLDSSSDPVTPVAGERYQFTAIWQGTHFDCGYKKSLNSGAVPSPSIEVPMSLAETDAISYNDPIGLANDTIGSIDASQSDAAQKALCVLDSSKDYADFDGTNDLLENQSIPDSLYQSDHSIMLVIKSDDGQKSQNQNIQGGRNTGTSNGMWMSIVGSGSGTAGVLSYNVQSNGVYRPAKTLSAVFDDGVNIEKVVIITVGQTNGIKIYVDKVLQTLDPAADGNLSGLTLSSYSYGASYALGDYKINGADSGTPYDGKLRMFRTYTKELSQAEVTAIVNAL